MSAADSGRPTGNALFERYKEALRRGHVAALEGDYDLAVRSYEEAASLAPDRAVPHASLGAVLRSMGRNDDALAAFERALHRSPSNEPALAGQAATLAELGRPAEAAEAFAALAGVLERAGRWIEASDAGREALDLGDSPERRSSLAAIAVRLRSLPGDEVAAALERTMVALRERPAGMGAAAGGAGPAAPPVETADIESMPVAATSPVAGMPEAADVDAVVDAVDTSELAFAADIDEASRGALLSWVEQLSRTTESPEAHVSSAIDAPSTVDPDASGPDIVGSEAADPAGPSPLEEAGAAETTLSDAAGPLVLSPPEAANAARPAFAEETDPAVRSNEEASLTLASPMPGTESPYEASLADDAPVVASSTTPPGHPAIRPTEAPTVSGVGLVGPTDSVDAAVALTNEAERRLDRGDLEGAHARFLAAAATHRAGGRVEAALDAYYPVVAGAPADGDLHLALAQLYLERGWRALAVDKLALLGRLADLDGNAALTRQICVLVADRLPGEPRLVSICPPRDARVAR